MKGLILKLIGLLYFQFIGFFKKAFRVLLNSAMKYYYFENKDFFINHRCELKNPKNISIGKGSIIGRCTIGADEKVKIGQNVTISQDVIIETGSLTRNGDSRHSSKQITIGNNCWIGARAIILGGVVLGENVTIGAGEVVRKSVPSNTTFVLGDIRHAAKNS
jgi:acetyltransferase-like isoleucine patch superfamily enzyme